MATALNIMDPDGDLLLKVGGELEDPQEAEVTFRVCSAALRRASPVFKNMLFGPWVESRPGGGGGKGGDSDDPWVVSLPEDKPKPTETVLAIIHGRFELMPDEWNLFTLEEILIVVDKYDMTPCLRPWGKSWTQMVRGKKSDFWDGVPNPNCHPSRVQVAWGLGEEDAFLFTVKNIIFSASLDENDDLGLDSGKSRINLADRDHFGPLNMLDIIKESRLTLIQTILDYYHSEVARLADPLIQVCRPAPQEVQTSFGFVRPFTPQIPGRVCDMAILGSIWTRLLVEDLPGGNLPKKASMVNGSANALLEVLVKMTLGAECTAEHKPCASRFAEFERATRASERWSKGWETEEHKKRLLMQRTKLGATVKETVVAPHPVQNKPQK